MVRCCKISTHHIWSPFRLPLEFVIEIRGLCCRPRHTLSPDDQSRKSLIGHHTNNSTLLLGTLLLLFCGSSFGAYLGPISITLASHFKPLLGSEANALLKTNIHMPHGLNPGVTFTKAQQRFDSFTLIKLKMRGRKDVRYSINFSESILNTFYTSQLKYLRRCIL